MISAYWLILAFFAGVCCGIALIAMVTVNNDNDEEGE